jgi:hypothetical protein
MEETFGTPFRHSAFGFLSLPVTSFCFSCGTRLKALPSAAGAMKAMPMRAASGTG